MCSPFLVSEDALQRLASTRQGRVSIGGYNYQAAYAVARLAAMHVRSPLLGLSDWPERLRYDWGEDLDEVCAGGVVRFTQCKRDASIGQPASLAKVLLGFAPKWLWAPKDQRKGIRFRLVCSDTRFATGGPEPRELPKDERAAVQTHFVETLSQPAGAQSDRAEWDGDAAAFGHGTLFAAIWERTDVLYLPPDVVDRETAGPRLFAEREALRLLLERSVIDALRQTESLGRLRRLVHDNLIEFDPASDREPAPIQGSPRRLERADVVAALEVYRPSSGREAPFQVVDRTFLSEQRELPRQLFVARSPEWSDVVHGQDAEIKFLEREQTADLENAVLEQLVKPIQRHSGRLPALFVVGPPGSGKTTLVRRVAARLVDDAQIIVADAGVGWREPAGDPEEYVEAISRLQMAGRPVVLLLDDPLYAESGWFDVFKRLNRPNLRVAILTATPQFLFDEHKHALRSLNHREYLIAPSSRAERTQLADLFGSKRQFDDRSDDDFLVLAMEFAAGVPFDEIIDRLWTTLADGRDFGGFHSFESLPWQVRAYVFVCFFSRVYEQCPEPLLREALQLSGGVEGAADVTTELARLRYQQGWRIFRIGRRSRTSLSFMGVPISASHTQIARRAWERRPLAWCDVEDFVLQASVRCPETILDVASVAARLALASDHDESQDQEKTPLIERLVDAWRRCPQISTRNLSVLSTVLDMRRCRVHALTLRSEFVRRAEPVPDGWVAAQQLWFLAEKPAYEFPAELDLLSLIKSADFSVAPRRAGRFAGRVAHDPVLKHAFVDRLLASFDGKVSWSLDAFLLTHLLAAAPQHEMTSRFTQIQRWLDGQPDDTYVRTQFLAFLSQLPSEFAAQRKAAAEETAQWVQTHPDDTYVRTQFLAFLLRLPGEFAEQRKATAEQTAQWLQTHPEDTSVRAQLLIFLADLGETLVGSSQIGAESGRMEAWQDLTATALGQAVECVERGGFDRQSQTVVTSLPRPHLTLLNSLKRRDAPHLREALVRSSLAASEWCRHNPTLGLRYELPLPS